MKKLKFEWVLPALAALIVFLPTVGTYFSQDDWVFLSHTYQQPFVNIFRHYPEAFYRPVGQQLFFYLNSLIFGLEPQGFHLSALLIHLANVWLLSRVLNLLWGRKDFNWLLLLLYAVNPLHLVALNWLTQVNLEIAVFFSLLTILLFRYKILAATTFLLGLLSHEITAFLPLALFLWFKQKRLAILLAGVSAAVLLMKLAANPFSLQSDYGVSDNPLVLFSTLKWYLWRALAVPEGIKNFAPWQIFFSLLPGTTLILLFRQKLFRPLVFYVIGILPVLGLGKHAMAGYAVLGLGLMTIELGKLGVGSRWLANRLVKTAILLAIFLPSMIAVNDGIKTHWSTNRGEIARKTTQEYLRSDSAQREIISQQSGDFQNYPEVYFAAMMGKQLEVLDRGASRGVFDWLFYRGNDLTTQFLPDALFFKDNLLSGKFPAWNPWIMAGMSYFLDPQNFLWYPPNYLLLVLPLELGFLILLIGHLVFAGVFVRKVSDTLQTGSWIGWLGAVMFVFSPKLISHIEEGNWTLVIAACWLPILYLALKKNKFRLTVISLSAIIVNNLNIGYYSTLFVLVYFLTHLSQKRSLLAPARKLLKILIAAAILTIPRWLPLALFGNQTVRAGLNEAPLPLWSWTKIVKSMVFPLAAGHPVLQNEEVLYLGILPLIVGVLGILGRFGKLGKERRFWIIWLGFVLLVVINVKTPFFFLVKLLPGFSLLRITTRPWIFASLATALVVPMTIRMIGEIRDIRGFRISRKIARTAELALLIVILVEFGRFDWKIFARREIAADPVPVRFYRQMAAEGVMVRAYCTTGCLDRLTTQRMGIALLGGNNPIQLKSFVEYLQAAGGYKEQGYYPILPPYTVFNQRSQPEAEKLGMTATKFVLSPYELTDPKLELMDYTEGFRIYKNNAALAEFKDHYIDY